MSNASIPPLDEMPWLGDQTDRDSWEEVERYLWTEQDAYLAAAGFADPEVRASILQGSMLVCSNRMVTVPGRIPPADAVLPARLVRRWNEMYADPKFLQTPKERASKAARAAAQVWKPLLSHLPPWLREVAERLDREQQVDLDTLSAHQAHRRLKAQVPGRPGHEWIDAEPEAEFLARQKARKARRDGGDE